LTDIVISDIDIGMTKRVLVQVSDATHADWKRAASERGVSMSEVARALIEREVVPGKRVLAVAPAAVTPSAVAATVPGVGIVRPHMKKNRPAVQCETRWPSGVCPDCGQTV
jgi:hypothetical protein